MLGFCLARVFLLRQYRQEMPPKHVLKAYLITLITNIFDLFMTISIPRTNT